MSTPSSGSSHGNSSSSALSASDFGPSFDLRAWINQQLEQGAAADANSTDGNAGSGSGGVSELGASTARLSSLLMRLQLLAADVNTTMEAQSQQLVHAMPKSVGQRAQGWGTADGHSIAQSAAAGRTLGVRALSAGR